MKNHRSPIVFCIAAALALLLAGIPAFADDPLGIMPDLPDQQPQEVSDEDLQRFGIALISIQQVQIQANEEIESIIDDSELSEERINEILQMQQLAPDELESELPEDEIAAFEDTIEQVTEVHEAAEEQMYESVEEVGFDIEAFNQLAQTIEQDPELMERLQEMFAN